MTRLNRSRSAMIDQILQFAADHPEIIAANPRAAALVAQLPAIRGRTVFMSSHVLSEVERVCDRVALLRKGELVLLSAVENVRKMAARRVRVFFRGDFPVPRELPAGSALVESEPRVWHLKVEGLLEPLLQMVAALPVQDLAIDEPRLEDVLIRYYREGSS